MEQEHLFVLIKHEFLLHQLLFDHKSQGITVIQNEYNNHPFSSILSLFFNTQYMFSFYNQKEEKLNRKYNLP